MTTAHGQKKALVSYRDNDLYSSRAALIRDAVIEAGYEIAQYHVFPEGTTEKDVERHYKGFDFTGIDTIVADFTVRYRLEFESIKDKKSVSLDPIFDTATKDALLGGVGRQEQSHNYDEKSEPMPVFKEGLIYVVSHLITAYGLPQRVVILSGNMTDHAPFVKGRAINEDSETLHRKRKEASKTLAEILSGMGLPVPEIVDGLPERKDLSPVWIVFDRHNRGGYKIVRGDLTYGNRIEHLDLPIPLETIVDRYRGVIPLDQKILEDSVRKQLMDALKQKGTS